MDDMNNRWTVNETLLQSYRMIFITSQTFLLAVGAIVLKQNAIVFFIVAAVSLGMIWWIWYPVVESRHKLVDFYKYALRLPVAKQQKLCSEDKYMHDAKHHAEANKLLGIRTHWRETRKKIDLWIPILFSFIWIVLSLYEGIVTKFK